MKTFSEHPFWSAVVLGLAAIFAAISCRDYAGSWNDGSRLATVESLVDHGTLAIDRSIFVKPLPDSNPYLPGNEWLSASGTMDKIYVKGHYYSDKSPVPAILMAGAYWTFQKTTGLTAAESPRDFTLAMTLVSSGVAYVIAVWCMYLLGGPLGLPLPWRLWLTISFALATVAPVYLQHVNNHILFLGVASPLMLAIAWLGKKQRQGERLGPLLLAIGSLTGMAYTIDLGVGPVLILCMGLYVLYRCRATGPVLLFSLAALPWLLLHHVVNYSVGGTLTPANSVADYFQYPGSIFSPENMTGSWKHNGIDRFLVYILALLFGKHGFIGHNLALFLLFPAVALVWRKPLKERPELFMGLGWAIGTWLLYGAASNNYSGLCASIRWFVPLLAPAFFLLAVLLRDCPHHRKSFMVLTLGGMSLVGWMAVQGPWTNKMVPWFWPVQGVCLIVIWWLGRREQRRMASQQQAIEEGSNWKAAA